MLCGNFWCVALEPYWERLSAVLNDDLACRRRIVAGEGLAAAMAAVDGRIDLNEQFLVVHKLDSLTADADGKDCCSFRRSSWGGPWRVVP